MHAATARETHSDASAPDAVGAAAKERVSLFARFMTPDHVEYPCQIVNMSPDAMEAICAHTGEIGMQVICYVNHIGRVEGTIERQFVGGFEIALRSSERRRDKIAAKLEWVVSHARGGSVDDRIHERVTPRNTLSQISTADGRVYPCRIIDVSLSGAAVELDVRPALGSRMVLGGLEGVVVRQFDEGIAIEFLRVQGEDSLQTLVG